MDQYREFGYAVVKSVFDEREIQELALAMDTIYAQGLTHTKSYRVGNTVFRLANDRNLGKIVRLVQWPAYLNATLERFRRDPRMLDIVEPILGNNLKQIINQLHWKPPGANMVEFGFHQDIRSRRPRAAYRHPESSYIQTGIAIDRHFTGNGAVTVYPGSHKLGELPSSKNDHSMNRAMNEGDLSALGLDPANIVPLALDPGDVALWHLHTLHGSGPNLSSSDRRFYINGYVVGENCDRGVWTFRGGKPCSFGSPVLVHNEGLFRCPEPHFIED